MAVDNNFHKVAYGLSQALINVFPAPIISNRAPTTADKAPLGTVWDYKTTNSVYILTSIVNNLANWTSLSGGAGVFSSLVVNPGDITVVAGSIDVEAGTITAEAGFITTGANGNLELNDGSVFVGNFTNTASSSAVTFQKDRGNSPSVPVVIVTGDALGAINFEGYDGTEYVVSSQITSTTSGTIATNRVASDLKFFTHPDSTSASTLRMTIAPTGAITIAAPDSGVALTITAGGQTITAGNLLVTAGNITASAGTITATAGQVLGATLVSTGDVTGAASQTAITNVVNTTQGAGTLSIKSTTANSGNNTGFIKIYVGGVVNYIPYFTTIAP